MKVLIGTLLPLLLCVFSRAETPELFTQKVVNPVILAKAANHFIAAGEQAAMDELNQLAAKSDKIEDFGDLRERIGWVCRIVFEPKNEIPLRGPMYGALHLPYKSMPLKNWPIFPLGQSGDSYFVLAQGRSIAGKPESASAYIAYCQANGVFVKIAVPIPSRSKALADADILRKSAVWQAIKWENTAQGYGSVFGEERVWKDINRQAESIP